MVDEVKGERNDTIIALAKQGKSNAEIAKAVGTSRGAVSGVVFRSGARLAPVRPTRDWSKVRMLLDRCRFPLWPDEGLPDHHYCGEKALAGKSYCEKHHDITHRDAPPATGGAFVFR